MQYFEKTYLAVRSISSIFNVDEFLQFYFYKETKVMNIQRQKRYYTSQLDQYKGEILTLFRADKKISYIKKWVKKTSTKDKGLKGEIDVAWSTIYRFIKKHT